METITREKARTSGEYEECATYPSKYAVLNMDSGKVESTFFGHFYAHLSCDVMRGVGMNVEVVEIRK